MNYLVIFLVSFVCVALELFWTRMLNLKSWNHVVYTVIPFAILGYGIGANLLLLIKKECLDKNPRILLGRVLVLLGFLIAGVSAVFVRLPIKVTDLISIFSSIHSIGALLLAYTLFMLPFILIGFIVVYLFSRNKERFHSLYAIDLAGAGFGALAFFLLIGKFQLFHSILLLALTLVVTGLVLLFGRRSMPLVMGGSLLLSVCIFLITEPQNYWVDTTKGWEYVPGALRAEQYNLVSSRWHPLGRTDSYRILDPEARSGLTDPAPFTFDINLVPFPEFSYLATNFLAGTPVYNLAVLADEPGKHSVKLFSVGVEAGYLLLKQPLKNVVIVGAGGGRDIFMARTHGAATVIGAEINPEIHRVMSQGGELYDYSGRIYDQGQILNVDARHLVKTLPSQSSDYIILNGVDTFSGLSSGAYAYAESYLYTTEAVRDYWRILSPEGVICFNRWLFDPPRETLRLQSIVFEALRQEGVMRPWEHVVIATPATVGGSALTYIKRTPFTAEEVAKLDLYMKSFRGRVLFPITTPDFSEIGGYQAFTLFKEMFQKKQLPLFEKYYPYDISVVKDDNPFFYKYYKFDLSLFSNLSAHRHTGTIVFLTQFVVLVQSLIFILLFILWPLWIFRKKALVSVKGRLLPFLVYFSCLGAGFMFFEIPLMQKFVLLLGSPIYSISVVLSGLLIWTGAGSALFPFLTSQCKIKPVHLITWAGGGVFLLSFFIPHLTILLNMAMLWPLAVRIVVTLLTLAPAGILLGFFFPAGLHLMAKEDDAFTIWAWGINCGFSVLGSILAIIIAQFTGFNLVILLAGTLYLTAILSFRRMAKVWIL